MKQKPSDSPYDNHYFQVVKPVKVHVQTGVAPTNAYYGNSRIYSGTFKEVKLSKGNEIHNLVGGAFAVSMRSRSGANIAPEINAPRQVRGAFERSSGNPQARLHSALSALVKSGKIRELTKPMTKIKYRTSYPTKSKTIRG